jgi:hypothetical protein
VDADGKLAVRNLMLSTLPLTIPTGITVGPGNSIDLGNCEDPDPANACPLAVNEAGEPQATIAGVQLFDDPISGLTLALIRSDNRPERGLFFRACSVR